MGMRVFLIVVLAWGFSACAHQNRKPVVTNRLERMAHETRTKQAAELQQEVDKILKIYRKNSNGLSVSQNKTEESLFAEVIASYRAKDLTHLRGQVAEFEKAFKQSPLLDNAIFLLGRLEYQKGHYPEALKTFTKITDDQAMANKRPGALLAKAQVYTKLKLYDHAESALTELKTNYKGAPETEQIETELKLIEIEKLNQ
jgi:TolA-binding protein